MRDEKESESITGTGTDVGTCLHDAWGQLALRIRRECSRGRRTD